MRARRGWGVINHPMNRNPVRAAHHPLLPTRAALDRATMSLIYWNGGADTPDCRAAPQFPASFLNFKALLRVAPVLLPGGQARARCDRAADALH